jgi:maltose alpha-D-glucosyltransferase/alpha-amylase
LSASEVHGAYLALARVLGQRTAELHRALATTSDDPAFQPEPLTRQDVRTWTRRVSQDAAATLDRLAGMLESIAATTLDDARSVLARRDELLTLLSRDIEAPEAQLKIRHHGDYHLGQVLLVHNDFIIVDFEGEPARTLDERRQKHSPLRDVAGMLRSFHYAAGAMRLREHVPPSVRAGAVETWLDETQRAFLDAYREQVRDTPLFGGGDYPPAMLDLLVLEKLVYELNYEIDHRPDWIGIPLRGILERLGTAA